MLNKLIGERDWSAQEISHFPLRLDFQRASRQCITPDCRPEELQNNLMAIDSDSGELKTRRSPTKHYRDRVKDSNNEDLRDSVTLFNWIRDWDWSKFRCRPKASSRVINYFPVTRVIRSPRATKTIAASNSCYTIPLRNGMTC